VGPTLVARHIGWRAMKAPYLAGLLLCVLAPCAMSGDRETLEQAANRAIDSLGKPDGYFGNPEVRIPLPGKLEKLRKVLQAMGASKEVDALVLAMNRAAETALPESRALITGAIRSMPPVDAAKPAATGNAVLAQQFRETMFAQLTAGMLPMVGKATVGVHLARSYNDVAGKASALGVLDQRDADLDAYVTRRALEGLFETMANEESNLRAGK
jgi:hypothetical protein